MTCERCRDLDQTVEIVTPGQLRQALAVVRDNLADGTIDDVESGEPLPVDGPWDDVISRRYACRHCGERFDLCVNVYHGRGGHWRPAASR